MIGFVLSLMQSLICIPELVNSTFGDVNGALVSLLQRGLLQHVNLVLVFKSVVPFFIELVQLQLKEKGVQCSASSTKLFKQCIGKRANCFWIDLSFLLCQDEKLYICFSVLGKNVSENSGDNPEIMVEIILICL